MTVIVLNELEYAEKCIADNYVEKKPFSTLSILAKYYHHHLGKDKDEIVELLKDFAKRNCEGYSKNKYRWDNNIAKMVDTSIQYPLHQIEGVWITSKELATIRNIHNKLLERLAFTILCLAKFDNLKNPKSDGWINYESKEIFNLARISAGINERELKFHELYKLGLIDFAKKIDNLGKKVCFIDTEVKEEDKELFISDFRELGYEYLLYRGENFIRCGECGVLTRGNKRGTKHYCINCTAYTPQNIKNVICVDCGIEFSIESLSRRIRCDTCYNEEKKRINRENQKKWKDKTKNNTTSF